MQLEILTRSDLQQFKAELLAELKTLISPPDPKQVDYLKSKEVKNLLKISNSTLQCYRESGKIEAKKIGGVYYYSRTSIENLFNNE
jgi:spore germination protein YaaH